MELAEARMQWTSEKTIEKQRIEKLHFERKFLRSIFPQITNNSANASGAEEAAPSLAPLQERHLGDCFGDGSPRFTGFRF
jgi:hypothetical protein